MTSEELNPIILELRVMAKRGSNVPDMLRYLGSRDLRSIQLVKCFWKAIECSIGDAKPVASWVGFGHDLSDEQVSDYLMSCVQKWLEAV